MAVLGCINFRAVKLSRDIAIASSYGTGSKATPKVLLFLLPVNGI